MMPMLQVWFCGADFLLETYVSSDLKTPLKQAHQWFDNTSDIVHITLILKCAHKLETETRFFTLSYILLLIVTRQATLVKKEKERKCACERDLKPTGLFIGGL